MKEIRAGMVINCSNEIEAKKLLMHLKANGYKWNYGATLDPLNTSYDKICGYTHYLVNSDKTVAIRHYSELPLAKFVEYSELFGENENISDEPVRIRLDSYSPRIRKMAIECPYCNSWFRYIDMIDERATRKMSESQIYGSVCMCPKCKEQFIIDKTEIYRPDGEEDIYKDCLKKKTVEVWE